MLCEVHTLCDGVASNVVIVMSHVKVDRKLQPLAKITDAQPSPNPETALNALRALEYCPVAIALASLSGELVSMNAEAEQIFGIAHGRPLSGHYIADAFVEVSHLAALEAVARDGRERHFEMFRTNQHGSRRRFLCKLARIAAGNGIPAWLALGMLEYDDEFCGSVQAIGAEQDITSIFVGRPPSHEKASILDTVASSIEGPIYAIDCELRFTYFNDFVR